MSLAKAGAPLIGSEINKLAGDIYLEEITEIDGVNQARPRKMVWNNSKDATTAKLQNYNGENATAAETTISCDSHVNLFPGTLGEKYGLLNIFLYLVT